MAIVISTLVIIDTIIMAIVIINTIYTNIYIYIYIYIYKHTSNNNDTRPTESKVGVSKGLREFAKGGFVKGGLAMIIY